MPNRKKRSAKRAKTKTKLLLTGSIHIPDETLPWERDLLEPVIKALHPGGGLAGGHKAEELSDG